VASGYAPLGAVLVSARVVEAFERGSGAFMHGFTYQAHPVSTAAGNAVFDYLESQKLFDRVIPAGKNLRDALTSIQSHRHVGDVRGLGLLLGVEFVKDKATREPFAKFETSLRKSPSCLEEHVLTYPTQGCVDGLRGDHILLAPPFTISPEESALIARALQSALARVFSGLIQIEVFFFIAAGSFLFLWKKMRPRPRKILLALVGCLSLTFALHAQEKSSAKPRARDLGVPFDGTPGPLNAITDVSGVTVGHTTLIPAKESFRSARALCAPASPRFSREQRLMNNPVFAGWWSLNGNGEMTGTRGLKSRASSKAQS